MDSKRVKEDKAIMAIVSKLQLMTYNALYDVFDFDKQQIRTFYEGIADLKERWSNDEFTTTEMLKYCETKKLNIVSFVNGIKPDKKMILLDKNRVPGVLFYFDNACLSILLIMTITLMEHFKFDLDMINKYLDKINFYIDSYTKKQPKTKIYYLNNNMILDIFKEEMHLDLATGEDV